MLMAKQMRLLGMDRADEKTYALAAALATQSHGLETTALLADVRLLKEYVKAVDAASLAPGRAQKAT